MASQRSTRYVACNDCGGSFGRRSLYRHRHTPGECKPGPRQPQTQQTTESAFDEDFFSVRLSDADKTAFLRDLFAEEIQQVDDDEVIGHVLNPNTDVDDMATHMKQHVADDSPEDFVGFTSEFLLKWQAQNRITDAALAHFLRFQSACYSYLGQKNEFCADVAKSAPQTLPKLQRLVGKQSKFTRYVICVQCKSLYDFKDCYVEIEGRREPKACPHIEFPNSRKRKRCGHPLLQEVSHGNGRTKLVPYKEYYYQKLEDALHRLVKRPGFEEMCESWREVQAKKPANSTVLTGLHDGNVWKDFNGGKYNFLTELRSIGLMLNLDFFQPYDHVNYSVGAIYVVPLNLPEEERFKKENVMLIGLIPNMDSEPSTNPFLDPLVDELLDGWLIGFNLTSHSSPETPINFKVALMCCGCDMPASRKVCGFLGHGARLGCNKCYKEFPGGFGEKTNYGGFDVNNWRPREANKHREDVDRIMRQATTKAERKTMESAFGVRYSVLLRLPYFDPIRMVIIDPMHNLFMGTGKHQLKVWKDTNDLTPADYERIQKHIDAIQCPSDIGRIPHKIASGFAGLTADQLKNWILLFSLTALQDILSDDKFKCWQKFVIICKHLCTRVIDVPTLDAIHAMIVRFCKKFEELYGQERVTPNLHMHCHLVECIRDFGPIYGYWLFPFERYNGWIENFSTNKKNIEGQLMKRFLADVKLANIGKSTIGDDALNGVMQEFDRTTASGTLLAHTRGTSLTAIQMCTAACLVQETDWSVTRDEFAHIKFKTESFDDMRTYHIKRMYTYIYPGKDFEICSSYGSTQTLRYRGHVLGTESSRSSRSCVVYANWCSESGDINTTHLCNTNRPGSVQEFIVHKIIINGEEKWHIIAQVAWQASITERQRTRLGLKNIAPSEQWSPITVPEGPGRFIPIQRIKCTAISFTSRVGNKDILYVTPRQRYLLCD